ncbi:hypothetical protein EDB85DRAFT_2277840, partial [Lactarius pseudohatsudake]
VVTGISLQYPCVDVTAICHEKKQSVEQHLPLNLVTLTKANNPTPQRICLIPKSATQILLTSAVHPHPCSSPILSPPIRPARSDPRHEDVVIASGPTLSSLTWPTIVRGHARHHVRCVRASLCRERGDKREVAVRLHSRAAQGCRRSRHCAAGA